MIDKKFNTSASKEEKLLLAEENRARLKKIEQISDQRLRDKFSEKIKSNERTVRNEKSKASHLEEAVVQETIKRNVAAKHQVHLKPKYGFLAFPRKQEEQIRRDIRRSMGADLDKNIKQLRTSLNKDLDSAIKQARSSIREKQTERRDAFTTSAKKEEHPIIQTSTRSRTRRS